MNLRPKIAVIAYTRYSDLQCSVICSEEQTVDAGRRS